MIWNFIKDILAPKKCYSCNKHWRFLCEECFNKQNNCEVFCYICKKHSPEFNIHKKCLIENKLMSWKNFNWLKVYFDKVLVLTHYSNSIIKKLITHFKFFWKKEIWEELSKHLSKVLIKNSPWLINKNTIILPVPMFFIRKILRGYNQSDILAKNVALNSWIYYNKYVLKRGRHTRQQSKLSQEDRTENLKNAFKINKKHLDKIDKRTIILVDDVISTGSTVNEIAKLLKQNGAKKVIVLCLASN